ncbi:SPOR domain-containing protein [uncultured Litoreibacter sp.]|uniref:SPOR domain-containing protein n=1 Tax=uncultured Litoreibacter sp. TaxID=1392394 RepID=UPI002629C312|nr:SPOR domain-containing protein [uncultured Litoreibacter sp.]
MAHHDYDAYGAQNEPYGGQEFQVPAHPGILSKMMSYVGAASSVALVIGLGIWGYQLTIRDVTEVPVIRALEGPARVKPDNAGGQLAQHQGLAVNTVQAEGEAEGPVPQVILAPEPIDLTNDDIILAAPSETEVVAEDEVAEAIGTVVSLSLEEQNLTVEQQAELLASRLADGVEPLEPLTGEIGEVQTTLARPEVPAVDPSVPGVKRSPRPALRPKVDLQNLQQTAAIAAAVGSVQAITEVDPASIASGTRLVQLGAYDDRETAISEWNKIAGKFEDYIEGKQRLIQEAKSGGRTFYRLRAVGFDDLNASRRFCAVLVAENAACIPVLAR